MAIGMVNTTGYGFYKMRDELNGKLDAGILPLSTQNGGTGNATGYITTGQKSGAASGEKATAEGYDNTASGAYSHAGGLGTIASAIAQTAIGTYNREDAETAGGRAVSPFIIGAGESDRIRANCFRVTQTACYGAGAYNSSGADYAELFEWADGNPDGEDRVGRFVTLFGEKIRLASRQDDFLLGIVSAAPSVCGDVADDQWRGMFQTDIFGRPVFDDTGRRIIRPEYDGTRPYRPRSARQEWAAVGLLGKLVMLDDGTCQVNEYCGQGDHGIATAATGPTAYRVLSRLDETHIRVLILP